MSRHSPTAFVSLLLISIGVWASVASLALLVGSTSLGVPPESERWAILGARLDVILLASLVGAALSAAGVVYQSVLRNPLADPYLLGVASGASLGAMLWRLPTLAIALPWLVSAGQAPSAMLGGFVAIAVVFACSTRRGRLEPVTLLLVGVIVSAICSAILLLLTSWHPELLSGIGTAASLLIGGLQTNLTALQKQVALGVIATGFVVLLLLSNALSVATLSDAEAQGLGLRINRLRWIALIVASVMVAAAVAISGPIGFVGLVCPHLGRLLVGPDPRRLLPVATALGAALLTAADALCRFLSQQQLLAILLPVGAITAMLGGPFFLGLLLSGRRREDHG